MRTRCDHSASLAHGCRCYSRPVRSTVDLVVFDIGGVLVQAGRTWADDLKRAGFSLSPTWLGQFEARLRTLPRRSVGAIDSERYHLLFAEASDGVFTPEDARRITEASLIAEYPGIATVFDELDSAGVATAVLSNANDAEWARLFPDRVPPEFPALLRARHRFSSHLLGVQKPDVRAFREVERVTGCSGEAILFFDDRAENVVASRQLGWTAELIDHTGDTAAQLLSLLRQHAVIR